ncbi:PDZ domain-containing protein [Lysobacter sp. HDW10]|uniref:PDZ domain-containing protein n=1 Tax=Lysobacter sp. HDW10 TaxID=2714936 RepID=UPI00140DCAF1|nr:PDZ domain-containing protein [Lysobacter sp. HDW10]QIK80649.1 PDZ domain-containing protein [Lysobacter sp. HDW10]
MNGCLKSLVVLALLAFSMSALAGKAHLGFTVHYTLKRSAFDAKLDHVVVTKVKENSPAMRAGLMPGDVIEVLNGAVVSGNSARKLDNEMGAVQPGDTVKMTVLRSGKRIAIRMVAVES